MTASVTLVPGFERCLEPDCTATPTAELVVTFGGLTVECGVCHGHVGIVDRLHRLVGHFLLNPTAKGTAP